MPARVRQTQPPMAHSVTPLRKRRVKMLLTQQELADRAGVSPFTIQQAEKGVRLRDLTEEKIARAVGVSRDELFPEPEEVSA